VEHGQGGVVQEVEDGGSDDEEEEEDDEDDTEGAAAYAATAPALWFGAEGGWEDGLSRRPRRRLGVEVSVGGGFL